MPLRTFTEIGRGFVRERVLSISRTIASNAVDAGNTGQTHILRAGLAMGIITASGKYAQYTAAATAGAGTDTCVGYLMHEVDLKDGDPAASATDHGGDILVLGHVLTGNLIGHDAAGEADLAGKIWHSIV
ncbi:MAG TPA: hypothetical protein PLU44_16845 [Candidatus Krumholzibacteria bacterium]|nr:hypothetical protein [Candidatus Krumholzibacteria bacterium]